MRRIIITLLLALTASFGCHRKSSVKPAPPAPVPRVESQATAPKAVIPSPDESLPRPPEPPPVEVAPAIPTDLELGIMNFWSGNYRQAAEALESFLSNNPESKSRDQALLYLGLSRALVDDNNNDLRPVEAIFRLLISQFPASPYKKPAAFILSLIDQANRLRSDIKERDERIKKLSDELQVLKEIDLQRRPSRPQE